jgi:hypothetical protein
LSRFRGFSRLVFRNIRWFLLYLFVVLRDEISIAAFVELELDLVCFAKPAVNQFGGAAINNAMLSPEPSRLL